jgi:hypothetical protein
VKSASDFTLTSNLPAGALAALCAGVGMLEASYVMDKFVAADIAHKCLDIHWSNYGFLTSITHYDVRPKPITMLPTDQLYFDPDHCAGPWPSFAMTWLCPAREFPEPWGKDPRCVMV